MAADRLGSISPLAGYGIRHAHDDVHEKYYRRSQDAPFEELPCLRRLSLFQLSLFQLSLGLVVPATVKHPNDRSFSSWRCKRFPCGAYTMSFAGPVVCHHAVSHAEGMSLILRSTRRPQLYSAAPHPQWHSPQCSDRAPPVAPPLLA